MELQTILILALIAASFTMGVLSRFCWEILFESDARFKRETDMALNLAKKHRKVL